MQSLDKDYVERLLEQNGIIRNSQSEQDYIRAKYLMSLRKFRVRDYEKAISWIIEYIGI